MGGEAVGLLVFPLQLPPSPSVDPYASWGIRGRWMSDLELSDSCCLSAARLLSLWWASQRRSTNATKNKAQRSTTAAIPKSVRFVFGALLSSGITAAAPVPSSRCEASSTLSSVSLCPVMAFRHFRHSQPCIKEGGRGLSSASVTCCVFVFPKRDSNKPLLGGTVVVVVVVSPREKNQDRPEDSILS